LKVKILKLTGAWWRARRADAAAMLVMVVFLALLFGWGIFRGQFLIGGDAFFQAYPLRTAAWAMIRAGQLPLWTPHVFSGYPMLAMPQLGIGYPLTWTHLFLPGRYAEMIYILAPFLLAPAFLYAYLRELGRSRLAALLGGLAYAYGGLTTNAYGMNAAPTNALMWLPLLLVAIERARVRRSLAHSTAFAALVYAMSILTGHGQSFLFVGMLAAAYAFCLALFVEADEIGETGDGGGTEAGTETKHAGESDGQRSGRRGRSLRRGWRSIGRGGFRRRRRSMRPLFACACGMLLAAGVGAFQILETMRAARRSIRSSLSYEFFVEASFTPLATWRSFAAPLYHFIEVTTYVSPLACALAVCALVFTLREHLRRRGMSTAMNGHTLASRAPADARVYFWAAVALVSVPLMLGGSTPLYRVLYHVPVFNLFRRPSRHVFEWTFALSVLAAYGWDALRAFADSSSSINDGGRGTRDGRRAELVAATVALLCAAALGFVWWRAAHSLPYVGEAVERAEHSYLVWKLWFTLALVAALALSLRAGACRRRELLLATVALLACFVEPYILIRHWWPGTAKTASRLTTPSLSTRYLQQFPAHENRVYVRANSAVEEYASAPRFDAHDLTALYGLHNVAGYEGLLLERYSRALGGLDYDAVNPRRGVEPTLSLFAPESHVLDLLNTTRVVAFANLATTPTPSTGELRLKLDRAALDPARWQTEEEFEGVVILRNLRAQPRAWLVGHAEAVDGEEALRRIRGESETKFDPRRTALLEVKPEELPALAGGELLNASARIVSYEPGRLVIETSAPGATVLVTSEIIYPGWEATVDGAASRIHTTNYLLRGVALTAGAHRVEMRYRAPAARNGALISLFSLLLLGGLIVAARRGEWASA
jgi:hypothetical protein